MKSSRVWNAYLPIGSAKVSTVDKVEEVTGEWLAARGCTESALAVLRAIRYEVLPLVARWPAGLTSYSILVHDRMSGVPCSPEDSRAFIHLRLTFKGKERVSRLQKIFRDTSWCFFTPVFPTEAEDKVHLMLDAQSAWYVGLMDANRKLGDLELLQLIRQHLHYFANMAQMRVQ